MINRRLIQCVSIGRIVTAGNIGKSVQGIIRYMCHWFLVQVEKDGKTTGEELVGIPLSSFKLPFPFSSSSADSIELDNLLSSPCFSTLGTVSELEIFPVELEESVRGVFLPMNNLSLPRSLLPNFFFVATVCLSVAQGYMGES